jgi:DNA-directed RNA polymerase specialized sigma24 family protein
MLGSLDDAEDVVQDALLRAWRYRESRDDSSGCGEPNRIRTWRNSGDDETATSGS